MATRARGMFDVTLRSQAVSPVPDSGTGELAGLSGTMLITIDAGNHPDARPTA